MVVRIDPVNGDVLYTCKCGRLVIVPVSDQVPGSLDYCGCGRLQITLKERQITEHRKLAGLQEPQK